MPPIVLLGAATFSIRMRSSNGIKRRAIVCIAEGCDRMFVDAVLCEFSDAVQALSHTRGHRVW
jgi:hypothetical protein